MIKIYYCVPPKAKTQPGSIEFKMAAPILFLLLYLYFGYFNCTFKLLTVFYKPVDTL